MHFEHAHPPFEKDSVFLVLSAEERGQVLDSVLWNQGCGVDVCLRTRQKVRECVLARTKILLTNYEYICVSGHAINSLLADLKKCMVP